MKLYIGWGKEQRPLKLYCGLSVYSMSGDRPDVGNDICCSPLWGTWLHPNSRVLMDSGAFNDKPEDRLTPDKALERQLNYEQLRQKQIARDFGDDAAKHWKFESLVAYDLLIDETWIQGQRHKRRWSLRSADKAIEETIVNAKWLASQRDKLSPRQLILPAQGVDAIQYAECAAAILQVTKPGDIFGMGGWCIVGISRSLLPEFWATIRLIVPMVAKARLDRIHIFGVTWLKALGGLLYLCDCYGIELSTDSSQPVRSAVFDHNLRGGEAIGGFVANRRQELANLRLTKWYREPPSIEPVRQLDLF